MQKIFFATFLASLILLSRCGKIEDPEFRGIERFGIRHLDFEAPVIGFDVKYFNPNNLTVAAKEASISVYLDSNYLGDFKQDSLISVSKKSEFVIPLSGAIPIRNFVGLKLNDLGQREVLLEARGSIKIGKAGIYVNKAINYSGRHRLSDIKL